MERFTIQKNDFLPNDCTGYFHLYYVGYGQPDNPDYLNTLKNIFVSTHPDGHSHGGATVQVGHVQLAIRV